MKSLEQCDIAIPTPLLFSLAKKIFDQYHRRERSTYIRFMVIFRYRPTHVSFGWQYIGRFLRHNAPSLNIMLGGTGNDTLTNGITNDDMCRKAGIKKNHGMSPNSFTFNYQYH